MVYAPKRVRNVGRRQTNNIELTTEEIVERDTISTEGQIEEAIQADIENKTQIAIDYLRNQNYAAMITAIDNDIILTAGQKILLKRIMRGQMALVQIIRQIGRTLDVSE